MSTQETERRLPAGDRRPETTTPAMAPLHPGASAQQWIYFRIYLGQVADRFDRAIVHLGRCMADSPHVQSWFYIRYVDEGGPHLRWRVLTDVEHLQMVEERLNRDVVTLLRQLHTFPADTYFHMVSSREFLAMAAGTGHDQMTEQTVAHNDVKVVRSVYEPELDKFGGTQGMPIAERLFHDSSRLCLSVLDGETQGLESRKTVAPWLMAACLSAFDLEGTASFWNEYAYYWLGGRSRPADDWRATFQAKGQELRDAGVPVLTPGPPGDPALQHDLERWRSVLVAAVAAYSHVVEFRPDVVCFNLIHLTNNRLGLTALEEAYMATLLEHP